MRTCQRLILLAALALLLGGAWLGPLDAFGTEQVNAGMKRALASFAVSRTLNAVISVAQGTEVGLGVVSFAPGQVLDPVNDLVEQFSTLMLIASASFGIQRVLIGIGSYWAVSALLSIIALWWCIRVWRNQAPGHLLTRILVALLIARFAVPLAALASEVSYRLFLVDRYEAAQGGIDSAAQQIANLTEDPAAKPQTESSIWPDWLRKADPAARFAQLQRRAEHIVEQLIDLIVVFTLQTLILPLLFLWIMLALARGVLGGRVPLQGMFAPPR